MITFRKENPRGLWPWPSSRPIAPATLATGATALVAPGEQVEIALSESEAAGPVSFAWGVRCLADLVVPRSSALVRHAGKQEKLSWEAWLGLDELPYLPWLKRLARARRDQPLRLMLGVVDRERASPRAGKEKK